MNSNHTTALTGVLEKIVFFNDENSYCIAELSINKTNKKVTILGTLPNIQCGETLSVKGEWIEHEKHGKQFKVNQNQKLFVNRLSAKEGTKVSFGKVFLYDDGGKGSIGEPSISGASEEAKVLSRLK